VAEANTIGTMQAHHKADQHQVVMAALVNQVQVLEAVA
jgi:hypothetical protein